MKELRTAFFQLVSENSHFTKIFPVSSKHLIPISESSCWNKTAPATYYSNIELLHLSKTKNPYHFHWLVLSSSRSKLKLKKKCVDTILYSLLYVLGICRWIHVAARTKSVKTHHGEMQLSRADLLWFSCGVTLHHKWRCSALRGVVVRAWVTRVPAKQWLFMPCHKHLL